MKNFKNILVRPEASTLDAMKVIESQGLQIALVVNERGQLMGTITDGDIRRSIISGIPLTDSCQKVMNKNYASVTVQHSRKDILALMQKRKITRIPVLDADQCVVDLKLLDELIEVPKTKPNTVVLMAGGLGSRLGELTTHTPKPMLKVGSKPILEIILDNFIEHGFTSFYLSVNFKAEVIEDYFGNGEKWKVDIRYLREKQKMGTAGSLSLLNVANTEPIIVMNGDLLTKVNFSRLIEQHEKSGAMATMCVRQYDFQVPYGVVEVEKYMIKNIIEKPVHSFFVNAGVYVLDPSCLKQIPSDEAYDMPHLFDQLIKNKQKADVFPIHEYWLDVGRKDDFEKAKDEYPTGE